MSNFFIPFLNPDSGTDANFLPLLLDPGKAPLDTSDKRETLIQLGYRNEQITDELLLYVRNDLLPFETFRIDAINAELTQIDQSIKDAIADSAVVKTCKTELNWAQQVKLLRQCGQELLEELARLYDIPLAHSRFVRPNKKYSTLHYQ